MQTEGAEVTGGWANCIVMGTVSSHIAVTSVHSHVSTTVAW
jgi:hypothetical protein